MKLPEDPAPYAERRARLARALGGAVAWIPAGSAVSRNYPAATFPFRASSHFLYLTGASIPGASLLLEDGEATLVVDSSHEDDALWHGEAPGADAIASATGCAVAHELRVDAQAMTVPAPDLATQQQQQQRLHREPGSGVDEPLLDALVSLRLVHDEAAMGALREAAEATVQAHIAGMRATRPGVTEHQIRAAMEHTLAARGLGVAYGPIVSVHGEVLHNDRYENICGEGDLLLADVGAEHSGGWAADVTRTWPVSGRFSSLQRELYEVVLASQQRAIARCRPGTRYRDVHLEASIAIAEGLVGVGLMRGKPEAIVADDAHALFFPHGIGHLLGLDVHDMEDLGDRAGYARGRARSERFGLGYLRLDRDLQAGMAVTIEPGVYMVPAILDASRFAALRSKYVDEKRLSEVRSSVRGIRIEDDVLITDDEPEVMTEGAPKSIRAVEAAVQGIAAG